VPNSNRHLITPAPGCAVDLRVIPTDDDGGMDKDDGEREFARHIARLNELQGLLYAESKQALLIVLQAMDTGGKDSTIREVLGPLNPQGVRVWNFKAPTEVELKHDFLWRVHKRVPGAGYIGVFNRSHYEDVLIVRVKRLVPEAVWRPRYEHINHFENLLAFGGTRIVKLYLHISREYQKERLQRRLDNPDKHWKFNPGDLVERALWDDYREAYEEALSRCSTIVAPWHVIPAERRWYRDLAVARILVAALEAMDPQYPEATFDPGTIRIE